MSKPKQKTKQAARKRFQFTASGKVRRRHIGQAHFNARSTGAETRRKHREQGVSEADDQRVRDLIPFE